MVAAALDTFEFLPSALPASPVGPPGHGVASAAELEAELRAAQERLAALRVPPAVQAPSKKSRFKWLTG